MSINQYDLYNHLTISGAPLKMIALQKVPSPLHHYVVTVVDKVVMFCVLRN